jgi:hypothetical protein
VENPGDFAVRIDQERSSCHTPVFLAIHRFLHPDAILVGDLVLLICKQNEGEIFLFLKFGLSGDRVGAYPDDDRTGCLVF